MEKGTKSNGLKCLLTMAMVIKKCWTSWHSKSLKIAWIVKYISDDFKSKWKFFWDLFLSKWGGKLVFLGNLEKKRRYQT